MNKLTLNKKLPTAIYTFQIRDRNSTRVLAQETWLCDGIKIEREVLSAFHPDDLLVINGQIEGKLIHVFKE